MLTKLTSVSQKKIKMNNTTKIYNPQPPITD